MVIGSPMRGIPAKSSAAVAVKQQAGFFQVSAFNGEPFFVLEPA